MKSLIILFLGMIAYNAGSAQVLGTEPQCGIYYTYDANGERILRKDDCISILDEDAVKFSFNAILYPNPTIGPFRISLNELVASASLSVFSISGVFIGASEIGEGYEMEYEITNQAPGTYAVSLTVVRVDGTQAEQSFTVVKYE